jgi:uncharacterized membrane protein
VKLPGDQEQHNFSQGGHMETKDLGKTSTGMQPNLAGLLSYVLGFITGIVFFLIEKENRFVRFHAIQSIITFGGFFVLTLGVGIIFGTVPQIALGINSLLGILQLVVWIVLMIKAYQGEYFKLPVIGDIAEKQVK